MRSDAWNLFLKQIREKKNGFRRGELDWTGLLLRLTLSGALAAIFSVFFAKFSKIYLEIGGPELRGERLFELLAIVSLLLFVSSAVGSAGALNRELFEREDLTLLSVLPVRPGAISLSGLITVFASQILFALLTLFPIALLIARAGLWRIGAGCLFLSLLSLSAGSLLAFPLHALSRFLAPRYLLKLLFATGLAALGFWGYAQVLGGVKSLLLGDDLKYFFSERVMSAISAFAGRAYPANLLSSFLLGRGGPRPALLLLLSALAGLGLSLAAASLSTLRRGERGSGLVFGRKRGLSGRTSVLSALLRREFLQILRTPGYAFSCFSTAAILPLMVRFCFSIASSLTRRLVGLDCDFELALLLTLLFGSLCNVFCSTNVSREGESFYVLKALPISAWEALGAKILFCLFVSVLAQFLSALALLLGGAVSPGGAIFLFAAGTVSSFAQICFSTRYDFSHPRFSADEEGEARESGGAVSAAIVFGLVTSLVSGGSALLLKLIFALRLGRAGLKGLSLLLPGGAVLLFAGLSLLFLARKLKERYYEFSGGGLL